MSNTHLAYFANIRLPTEKAHGLQIMQMCEAFAELPDCTVQLYVPRRVNTPELSSVRDVWAHYAISIRFGIVYVPCVDLFRVLPPRPAFLIQTLTYLIALTVSALNPFRKFRADLIYSRDPLTLVLFSLWTRSAKLCYEAHQLSRSRIQTWCVRRVGMVVAVTGILAQRMREKGAVHVTAAHDGFSTARFADPPDQVTARQRFDLPADALIIGYVGRLHTLGMSKGVEAVIDAIAQVHRADQDSQSNQDRQALTLLLVGGPDDQAQVLRQRWIDRGLPADHLYSPGTLPPDRIPTVLAACDICTMPLPWTEHFAYYASSLKLFEYMAAKRAIVASDLPSTAEVVQDGRSALLFPPDDVDALATVFTRLRDDPDLRKRLADAAYQDVWQYQWRSRAEKIIEAIRELNITNEQSQRLFK